MLPKVGLFVLPFMGGVAWGWRVGVLIAACELCGWVIGQSSHTRGSKW